MSAYDNSYIAKFKDGQLALDRNIYSYIPSSKDQVHQVIEGDRLDTIAFKYYNNSKLWYIIADVNGIINPFELEIGIKLLIPGLT